MRADVFFGKRGSIVIFFLCVMVGAFAQDVVVPISSGDNLNKASEVTETNPSLSFVDYPARWQHSFEVNCRKAKECNRKAKSFAKKKQFISALGYAAKSFDFKLKKRTERKALEILTPSNLVSAQKEYEEKIKAFPDVEYEGWISAKPLYDRMWFMQKYNLVNYMLKGLEHPKVKLDVKPISSHLLGNVASKLSDFRMRAAEEYYDGAVYYLKKGNSHKDKMDWKRAAIAFWIADLYDTDFKDAKSQYESVKKLAVSTVYISSHYETFGGFARVLDEDVKAALQQIRGFNGLQFVEINNSKSADYHVKLVANGLEMVTRGKTSDKREFSKKVKDENGNEVTKKATVTTYTSGYNARAKINVDVVEKKTNKVIYSTVSERTYEWVTVWQKGTGDMNIVKGKYKRYIGKSPDRAPQRKTLYERAIGMCADNIAHQLYNNFFRSVGASPTH